MLLHLFCHASRGLSFVIVTFPGYLHILLAFRVNRPEELFSLK